jgi:tetratricopeptide (TPR) repeat protein
VALDIGDARLAADSMERAMNVIRADPKAGAVEEEFVLAYARALAADGAWLVPDVASDYGFRYRYDVAEEALEALMLKKPPPAGTRALLYDVCLRYGDTLASLDRPAMALIAYGKAFELTGGDEKQAAAQHRGWLVARLAKEEEAAKAHVEKADKAPGKPEIGNALAEMYVVLCRENLTTDADALFAKLEHDIGGTPPALRYHRAVQRYAAREDPDDQAKAENELLQVLREDPSLHRARYELARVLQREGTIEKLKQARTHYAQAAREGAGEDWSVDALDRAEAIETFLKHDSEATR